MCHARRHLALKRIPIISAHGFVATLAAIVSPSTRIARFSFSCAVTSRLQNGGLRQRCISRLLVQAQQYPWRLKRLENVTAKAPLTTNSQPIAKATSCSSIRHPGATRGRTLMPAVARPKIATSRRVWLPGSGITRRYGTTWRNSGQRHSLYQSRT